MLRFCDKEVCCVLSEELDRGTLLRYFFQGNMDEMVCVINADGTYYGRVTYYSLITCDKIEDAVWKDYVVLDESFWENAMGLFVTHEKHFREHVLLPVVDEKKRLISFAYGDGEANREMRMLKELQELPEAITFADVYPQYDCVKICGFNELALRFAEYLRGQNICVETDGELWERFFPKGDKTEVPDYKRLVIYAEGVHGARPENWVENLLTSVSPEFECIDCIYEANWKAGKIRDTDTDIAGLLEYLRSTDKEIVIVGNDMGAQNVYDFLLGNGIEARYFMSGSYEERERLLFGKGVLDGAEAWTRRRRLIFLDYLEKNSALGIPMLEGYSSWGYQRNRDLFFLRDYMEIPCDNLKHTLKDQKILFVGDIFLCNRVAKYLKENVDTGEMFFADILDDSIGRGVCETGIWKQADLKDIDKDVLCLIVVPEFVNKIEKGSRSGVPDGKKEIVHILKENGICNYTDYFSHTQTFIDLEKDIVPKGFRKEQFRPKKIIFGASNGGNGNSFIMGLLDNHPSILMISDWSFFNNNLFWLCVRLADVPSEKAIPVFRNMYQSESDVDLRNVEIFEEKMRELMEAGETYTSQELFVILMIAYVAMYGRNIDDVRNMVIYWEPHHVYRDVTEKFVEWMGNPDGLCGILKSVRNICMVKGRVIKHTFVTGGLDKESALINCVASPYIPEKNYRGCERHIIKFEELKLEPRKELSKLCEKWEIPWSETFMETTRYGQNWKFNNGHRMVKDFDLAPVYNNYEEYFSSYDRFRITLICAPWQRKYGYPYVEVSGFSRRELQEMFLKEFRFEKELSYNGEKGKLDAKIGFQQYIRMRLWNVRKQELLEKYPGLKNSTDE